MSTQHVIARRYARGLMMASDLSHLTRLADELRDVVFMIEDNESLHRVFTDPAFLPEEKKAVIDRLIKQASLMPVVHNFLHVLVDKGRLLLLPFIFQEFMKIVDDHLGRVRVVIQSAMPLSETEKESIASSLKSICHKELLIESTVDESLLAGVKITMAGITFDGSAKAKLSSLKDSLLRQKLLASEDDSLNNFKKKIPPPHSIKNSLESVSGGTP